MYCCSENKLFWSKEHSAYTINCPLSCPGSALSASAFELLSPELQAKYRRFTALDLAQDMHVVWCPHIGCGHGMVPSVVAKDAQRRIRRASRVAWHKPQLVPETNVDSSEGVKERKTKGGKRKAVKLGKAQRKSSANKASTIAEQTTTEPLLDDTDMQLTSNSADSSGQKAVDTSNVDLSSFMECLACAKPICRGCQQGHGSKQTCAQHAAATQCEDSSAAYIRESTKPCPTCSVPLFKDGGCNHVTCSQCAFQFCWLHMSEWTVGGACQQVRIEQTV